MPLRDNDVNLYDYERLKREFGGFVDGGEGIPGRVEHELIGEGYQRILTETARIVAYQWCEHLDRSALKGFLFHGGVGVGKTAMAKRLTYELCRRFGDNGMTRRNSDEVVMILI